MTLLSRLSQFVFYSDTRLCMVAAFLFFGLIALIGGGTFLHFR